MYLIFLHSCLRFVMITRLIDLVYNFDSSNSSFFMHRTCLLMAMSVICNALKTVNSHSVDTVRESHDTFDSRLVACTDHIFVHRKYRYRYCLERYSRIITITYYAHSKSYILNSLWFFTIFLVLSFSVIVLFSP